jgi:hypothetical protein
LYFATGVVAGVRSSKPVYSSGDSSLDLRSHSPLLINFSPPNSYCFYCGVCSNSNKFFFAFSFGALRNVIGVFRAKRGLYLIGIVNGIFNL